MTQLPTLNGSQEMQPKNLNDKIIQAISNEKLLYTKNLRAEFMAVLVRIGYLLGVTPERMPNNDQVEVLFNFAKEKWYSFTLQEIELAIKSNIANELDVITDFKGYISADYISSCLKNYLEHKRKAVLRQKALEDNQRPRDLKIEDKEHFDFIKDWYAKTGEFPFADYFHAFEYAWKEKMFTGVDLTAWMEKRKEAIVSEVAKQKNIAGSMKERDELLKQLEGDNLKTRLRREAIQMIISGNGK